MRDSLALLNDLAAAESTCAALSVIKELALCPRSESSRLKGQLAAALRTFLDASCGHARFRRWVHSYFVKPEPYALAEQRPSFLFYPGLTQKCWFTIDEIAGLKDSAHTIELVKEEVMAHINGLAGAFTPYVGEEARNSRLWQGLAERHDWSAIHLLRRGVWNEPAMAELPVARSFLEKAPLAWCPPHAPECFISRLMPGVRLPAHYGLSNIKLTVHLPLQIPKGRCTLTAGGEARTWTDGALLVFDDSFLHWAENATPHSRLVLILDIWHPELDEEERRGLAEAIALIDAAQSLLR